MKMRLMYCIADVKNYLAVLVNVAGGHATRARCYRIQHHTLVTLSTFDTIRERLSCVYKGTRRYINICCSLVLQCNGGAGDGRMGGRQVRQKEQQACSQWSRVRPIFNPFKTGLVCG